MPVYHPAPGGAAPCDILDLTAARQQYPDSPIFCYTRASGFSGGSNLPDKTSALATKIQAITGEPPVESYFGVESGSIYKPRPALELAAEQSRGARAILVAPTLNRFIRPAAAYDIDYRTDRAARSNVSPTPDEWNKLRALTHGVVLATVLRPSAGEDEQLSFLVKLGNGVMDDEIAAEIFHALGRWRRRFKKGRFYDCWDTPLTKVAKRFGVSAATITRYADLPSPLGPTWRQLASGRQLARSK